MLKGNAVVGQSGGPTAAINATLSGVIRGAKEQKGIQTLFGMKNGIEGFLNEQLVDLTQLVCTEEDHKLLECTPAAALGSCRKKLPAGPSDPIYDQIFALIQKYDIRYFFYIGGNDSMDTVNKLSICAQKRNYEIYFMGVPKTIDNDLEGTDHTPGFGSAAKFVATTVCEIARDCAVYTIPAVTIVEIMGRDAGWLTAAAGLPALSGEPAADFIYLPERVFDADQFILDIRQKLTQKPNLVIAVSEGLKDQNGKYVGEATQSGSTDIFGHKYLAGTARQLEQLVKEKIGCKVRSVELSLPQRCAGHLQSKQDIEDSVLVGREAVRYAVDGQTASIAAIRREPGEKYAVHIDCVPVAQVANKIRTVPSEWITSNNVKKELLTYLQPLIEGQTEVPYQNGIPKHFIIP